LQHLKKKVDILLKIICRKIVLFFIAQQAAKDTGYSMIVIAGVAALGGLCYLMLRELYSRETPNGIYKEASKMCLANTDVNDLGKS
jgi:uncharacterized membrane protein YebE (DUF533 family)